MDNYSVILYWVCVLSSGPCSANGDFTMMISSLIPRHFVWGLEMRLDDINVVNVLVSVSFLAYLQVQMSLRSVEVECQNWTVSNHL